MYFRTRKRRKWIIDTFLTCTVTCNNYILHIHSRTEPLNPPPTHTHTSIVFLTSGETESENRVTEHEHTVKQIPHTGSQKSWRRICHFKSLNMSGLRLSLNKEKIVSKVNRRKFPLTQGTLLSFKLNERTFGRSVNKKFRDRYCSIFDNLL